MSTQSRRVLLIGLGPLPSEDPETMGFGQLRTQGFLDALLEQGHTVGLITIQSTNTTAPAAYGTTFHLRLQPEKAGWLASAREAEQAFGAERIVTAGPYNPGRVGAAIADARPFWMDVPGDPFAEAQAKTAFGADATAADAHARASLPGLLTADAFSVISDPQRYAMLGALGWSGRLAQLKPNQKVVHVVPIAYDFGTLTEQQGRTRAPGAPLVLALTGGFNTWFDTDTLLGALIPTLHKHPSVSVICTGGAIEGHNTDDYRHFCTRIEQEQLVDRVALHGWVPHDRLPTILQEAHLLLCLDRPGIEPELGGRTRVLFGLHQGLEVLANASCEQVKSLASAGHVDTFPQGDTTAFTEALESHLHRPQTPERISRAQAYLQSTYAQHSALAPMLNWLEHPYRFPALETGTTAVALQNESDVLRAELDAIHRTPTWRTLGAIQRRLRRE